MSTSSVASPLGGLRRKIFAHAEPILSPIGKALVIASQTKVPSVAVVENPVAGKLSELGLAATIDQFPVAVTATYIWTFK
jgi:hypothetical protein